MPHLPVAGSVGNNGTGCSLPPDSGLANLLGGPASAQCQPAPGTVPAGGGTYGTKVHFIDSPTQAAQLALKDQKLLFLLHIAGNFEDDKFT